MSALNRPYAYSKMHSEDPEEIEHRRAEFLIYKVLQKADRMRSRQRSWLRVRVRVFKLKIKIGRKLKKLRKGFSFSSTLILAKPDFCTQIACVLKSCKNLIASHQKALIGR
ncbi:UNVERIFIED_CONTAM: hypothetical protein Sindi_0123200 [Sesamum indicum]